MQVFIAVVAVFLVVIGLLWIIVPAMYGLPPVSTKRERIRKALELQQRNLAHKPSELRSDLFNVLSVRGMPFGTLSGQRSRSSGEFLQCKSE